jgi:hypothetical protein
LVYKYDVTDDCYYLTYSPDAKGETIIVSGTYDDGINGVKPVKYLACMGDKGVFEGNTTVKKIILPASIVSINGDAFEGCSKLEYVEMPGVKSLQQGEANRDSKTDEFGNWYGCTNTETALGLKSMFGMFKLSAEGHPDAFAYEYYGTKCTYAEMTEKVEYVSNAYYEIGVRKGEIVTVLMANTPEAVLTVYALNRIGAVANIVHPLSGQEEIKHYIN